MPHFCIQFYANYTILATQRGAWHHAPSKYAPVTNIEYRYVYLRWEAAKLFMLR